VRVFISYRREDSAGPAGWLYDRLSARYSPESVFMDVAGIQPGADFEESIENAVGVCNVMLAVMGPKWPGRASAAGARRIDDPNDFVRLEIAAALKLRIAVIGVLVDGAAGPAKDGLPRDIAELAQAPAVELRESCWDEDVGRLIAALEQHGDKPAGGPQRWWKRRGRALPLSLAAALILVAVVARKIYQTPPQPPPAAETPMRVLALLRPAATMHASPTRALAALPDGRVACASANGIAVWDLTAPTPSPIPLDSDSDAMSLAVLPGGLLAWGTRSGSIKVWDLGKGQLLATLTGHTGAVAALAPMEDGRLTSGSWDGGVGLWSLVTGKLEKTLASHTSQVRALAALGNGRLVSGSTDGTIIVWTLNGETDKMKTFNRSGKAVSALARLTNERIAAGTEDGAIEIWDYNTGSLETRLQTHRDWINALVILGDGRVASASDDQTIGIWNPPSRDLDSRLEGHIGRVNALAVLPDGRLVSGSEDGTIRLWKLKR
jgi:hypothetical protein